MSGTHVKSVVRIALDDTDHVDHACTTEHFQRLLSMLEVGVEDEADAPLLDDMVTQADLDPLHVLLETVDGLVQQLRLDQTLDIYLGNMRRC